MKFPKEHFEEDAILNINITMDTKELKGGIDKVVLRPPGNAQIDTFKYTGLLNIERSYKLKGKEVKTESRRRRSLHNIFSNDEKGKSSLASIKFAEVMPGLYHLLLSIKLFSLKL